MTHASVVPSGRSAYCLTRSAIRLWWDWVVDHTEVTIGHRTQEQRLNASSGLPREQVADLGRD